MSEETVFPNNWLYIYNPEPLFFDVIPNSEKPVPDNLYKYYSLSANSIDALTKNYIYVSHPEQLNDVFDSSEHLLVFDDDIVNNLILNDSPLSDSQKKEIKNEKYFLSKFFREQIYSKLGVFSMTEDPFNTLMWAYYTNNRGFAIEFDIKKLANSSRDKKHGPFPINYVSKIKPIRLSEVGLHCATLMQSNIKQKIWHKESEWRLLVECENGNYLLPSYSFPDAKERKSYYSDIKAIESVWLATKFFDEDELQLFDSDLGILYFELKSKIELKSSILAFLSKNEIKTYYWCQKTLEMLPIECRVDKICSCKYKLSINKISKKCLMS